MIVFFSWIRTRRRLVTATAGEADCGAVWRRGRLLRNDKMYNLINEVNGSGRGLGGAGSGVYEIGDGQLAPKCSSSRKQRAGGADAGDDHYGDVEQRHGRKVSGGLRITEDANTLSQLMAAGLLYKKYQRRRIIGAGAFVGPDECVPSGIAW